MRTEDAQSHFDRKPVRERTLFDVLKIPNQRRWRVALNKAAVFPFVANVDAFFGIEIGCVAESKTPVNRDAGGKHIFNARKLVLAFFPLSGKRNLM